MSRAPDEADLEQSTDYLEAFEQVFRLHERGMSFSGRERNCAFLNTGDGFADFSAGSGLDFPDDGRGLAVVDWDQDGDLDLWFANRTAPHLRFMRNESRATNGFLRLALEGRESARDAIGARVELRLMTEAGEVATLARTLRAGEGFLSQSSKWLHFGLGEASSIAGLTVRWPSGRTDTLPAVAPNRHYRLVEGSGALAEWTPPDRRLDLVIEPTAIPKPTTPPRVVFAARAPMPPLEYRSFASEPLNLDTTLGSPLLINLWATWCLPCVGELEDLTEHEPEIEEAGLSVLALSVDGLDEEQLTSPDDARRFLDARGFPFTAGLADASLLTKLQILHDNLFSTHLEIAIPTSFLVDADGRLAALYRGPVETERLLEDVRNLAAPATRRRQLAAPLPGRWLAPVQELRLNSFAQRYAEEGFGPEAAHYLRLELARQPSDPALLLTLARRLVLDGDQTGALDELRRGLPATGGDDLIRTALAELALELGTTALRAGDSKRATPLLEESLEHAPGRVDALMNLAIAHLQETRLQDAERLIRRAIVMEPDSAAAYSNLGIILARRGALGDAVEAFERALELDPAFADARSNLEALRRTGGE